MAIRRSPLLRVAAILFCFALVRVLLAADPPALPGGTGGPCILEQLEQAKTALKEANDKLAELDKDPRRPAPGKFSKDYENDKASADADVKLSTTAVTNAEKSLDAAKQSLAAQEKAKGAQYSGKTTSQTFDEKEQLQKQMKANSEQLAKAMNVRNAITKDPRIVEQARLMAPELEQLQQQMGKFMDSGKADPILARLSDPAARADARKIVDDNSYATLEFTAFTPDGNAIGHAERLADHYTIFTDRQADAARRQLQGAAKDARDGKQGAQDEIRRLGPLLIAEINRCRAPVAAAFGRVAGRLDTIDNRIREIDPDGADLLAKIPELSEEGKKLDARKAALDVQMDLAAAGSAVVEARKALDVARRALEDAKKAAGAADLALVNYKGYDALIDPWMNKKKSAESDLERLQKTADAETKTKDAVLAKAQADYAANEKDLADFRALVLKEKAEIDKLRATDAKAANTQLLALRDKVTRKKADAAKIVEAIKAALDPHRRCFKDVNEYVENIVKPKILALGGTAGAGLAVSDTEDPWAALLDVPVDKAAPAPPTISKVDPTGTGEEWVRLAPVIASDNTEGKMPKNLKASTTSLTYTAERDGKSWANTLSWSEPPATLKRGDTVTLTMSSTSQQGWGNVGGWWNIRCAKRDSLKGDATAGSDKNWRRSGSPDPHSATCTFVFEPGSNPHIQFSGGHDPNPSEWMLVTWKYEKKAK